MFDLVCGSQGFSGTGVTYSGKPVQSLGQSVYWRVELWDGSGRDCGLSPEIGSWSVGPLSRTDWQGAEWITQFPASNYTECAYYEDHPVPQFRTEFTAEAGSTGILHIAGLGYYTASIDGVMIGDRELDGPWTDYSKRVMFSSLNVSGALSGGGPHALGVELGNGWWNPASLRFWGSHDFRQYL